MSLRVGTHTFLFALLIMAFIEAPRAQLKKKISPPKDCQTMKGLEFKSLIIQKIKTVGGLSTSESLIPLENLYYPQMSRPSEIIVSSPAEVVSLTFFGEDRQTYVEKPKQVENKKYHFTLPSFEKFKGAMLIRFKNGGACEKKIAFAELSP